MIIERWRNIFFFEGLVCPRPKHATGFNTDGNKFTVIIALIAPFFMPQGPGTYKFLTPRQRYIAAERLRRENANVSRTASTEDTSH